MRKLRELQSNGCLGKAADDEMIFVLLARDAAAPVAILAWVEERIRIGKNKRDDAQIIEAIGCAKIMEEERHLSLLQNG